ncbi:MAG: VWA domain-containing protein [Reyranella sp.]|uniref:vWA domain-containing protein n=1 Tax=Reyranella sp. TaxID=1929291 RepID=UPI001209B5C9|nr:vWA domain-containing protein [Reyranella sp.]TAJ42790.1 MAG: VWA domain-containing protein [Reyranella sp.]
MFDLLVRFLRHLFGSGLPTPSRVPVRRRAPSRPAVAPAGDKAGAAVHAAMRQQDVVAIIGTAASAHYLAAPSPLGSAQLDARVRGIPARLVRRGHPGHATNYAAGLEQVRTWMAAKRDHRVRRAVLVSDGEDNTHRDHVLPLVGELRRLRVRLDCIAFATSDAGAHERLGKIARAGGGTLLQARGLADLRSVLMKSGQRVPPRQPGHRLADIALVIDTSASMLATMPAEAGKRRIDVATQATLDWLAAQRLTYL